MKDSYLNIALATDNKYVLMTCMCINDIILNKNVDSHLKFYVLLNNVDENAKRMLLLFNKVNDINVVLIDITTPCKEFELEYEKINSKQNMSGHVSGTSFMRIFLPEILKDVDKLIYLDQDIYVNGDLHDFYDIDIEDMLLAAPIDTFSMLYGERFPSYQICRKSFSENKYIQAGQLLMNLKKMREFGFSKKCVDFLKANLPPNKDMDVINAVCCDLIKPLDQRFCVPRAAIELAKIGLVSKAFLDIQYYNKFLDTGCASVDELIEKGLIWHFYGNKAHDLSKSQALLNMFNESKLRYLNMLAKLNPITR